MSPPLEIVRSRVLDVPHGFSTRAGGVSTGPFASLNLGSHVSDDPAAVATNRARLLAATGARELALLDQVHGSRVLELRHSTDPLQPSPPPPVHPERSVGTGRRGVEGPVPSSVEGPVPNVAEGPSTPLVPRYAQAERGQPQPLASVTRSEAASTSRGEADASWTRERGVALCIGMADCLPILLHAPDLGAVGAAHAGWRGAELKIAAVTVRALAARGGSPSTMRAVLGPCIRRCCYEVSPDLADRFERAFGSEVVDRSRPTPHLDLAAASRLALLEAGVPQGSIDDLGLCTSCDAERFFSHRRDHGRTGRMLAYIFM